jgi:hypothetical protein
LQTLRDSCKFHHPWWIGNFAKIEASNAPGSGVTGHNVNSSGIPLQIDFIQASLNVKNKHSRRDNRIKRFKKFGKINRLASFFCEEETSDATSSGNHGCHRSGDVALGCGRGVGPVLLRKAAAVSGAGLLLRASGAFVLRSGRRGPDYDYDQCGHECG